MERLLSDELRPYLLTPDGDIKKHPDGKSGTFKLVWAMLMLFSGTFTTLFAKALFSTSARGTEYCDMHDDDDKVCEFNKPWFTVLLMKLSMSLCVPIFYMFDWAKESPLAPNPSWRTIKAVAWPASLDLLNTVLGNIGLLYVNSSIYQMTRGSVVIFSAVLSVKYLGRRLRSFHYFSILMIVVAVILVGTAGIMQPSDDDGASAGQVILGLGFILLAQMVTAVQFIAEESLMNNKLTTLDPVALVGFEGIWGLAYFVVLAPILTFTPPSNLAISIVWHEDFGDTIAMLSNSTMICLLSLGYFVAILMYNISANFVTQCLSAVIRSILEACRVMGVWAISLLLWYLFGSHMVGEKWTSWSFLQLFGFVILLYGTFAYKALVKLPCVAQSVYELAEQDLREEASRSIDSKTSYSKLLGHVDEAA